MSGTVGAAAGRRGRARATTTRRSRISNTSRNRFWETLEKNIKDMLRETDKLLPEGSSETFVSGRGQSGLATTPGEHPAARPRGTDAVEHGDDADHAGPDADAAGLRVRRAAPHLPRSRLGHREPRGGHRHRARHLAPAREGRGVPRAGHRLRAPPGADRGDRRRGAAQRRLPVGRRLVGARDQRAGLLDPPELHRREPRRRPPFFSITYNNPNPAAGGNHLQHRSSCSTPSARRACSRARCSWCSTTRPRSSR